MPVASRARPAGSEVLQSFSGHVRARPTAVFDALDHRLRPGSAGESHYFADSSAFFIVAQGGWWYRGEYRVVPDANGSHIEHQILNVAKSSKGIARFSARRIMRESPAAFEKLVRQLRLELE